ncbi:glycosyltransferase [Cytobacillus solani]|uniref:glycosyltransferase n=1 Tax=Cytobacillus solani TaxID=1637975 RepID=UPI00207A0038|nr:glycosyltransferase [Cytobacillus solani]USK54617.1 glycosyltransferase [Cytobacillus solani]
MNELNEYKKNIKEKLQLFINSNLINEAKDLIDKYEVHDSCDDEIYSMKAVIAIMEGDYEIAELVLKEGLLINKKNVDLLFNMGYLYELQGKFQEAYKFYQLSLKYSEDQGLNHELRIIISNLLDNGLVLEDFEKRINTIDSYRKKVLIIAYYYPPLSGSGVQRTLKFVKYLRDFGWEPVVITVGKSNYPLKDSTLLKEIPDDLELHRIEETKEIDSKVVSEVMELYKSMLNSNLMDQYLDAIKHTSHVTDLLLPDSNILWANNVLKEIEKLIDFNSIDLIYTTSGPYSDHIIGYFLKKKYDKPWVVDFRDEWTNNPYAEYNKEGLLYKLHYDMESKIISNADKVITVTPPSYSNYKRIFKPEDDKLCLITNGYDESDFTNINFDIKTNEKFTITHNGLFYSEITPETFLIAISNLINKGLINSNEISVNFSWAENLDQLRSFINTLQLDNIIEIKGYMSHIESLKVASKSDLLLLIIGSGERKKSVYTGKVFEYLRLCKPILSLSPKGSVIDELITGSNRGVNVEFKDVSGIEEKILFFYSIWKNRNIHNIDLTLNDSITVFDRRELTSKLAREFDCIITRQKENSIKPKLAFFTVRNGDSFLNDIMSSLKGDYNIQLFIIDNLGQIEDGMKWADICWFEWCDELIIHASKLPIANQKKIICRIHGYEVYTDNILKTNWKSVDHLIFVAPHIKRIFREKISEERLSEGKISIIFCGVNEEKYPLHIKKNGFNIGYLGYINYKKNIPLTLKIFYELYKKDQRYRLFLAGTYQDERTMRYVRYFIEDNGLENIIVFEGWQEFDEKLEWLKKIDYMLISSIDEGLCYAAAESMLSGIKPVLHNCEGIKDHYDTKYIFNTIDEAMDMITKQEYNSMEYRKYVQTNYSLVKEIRQIKNIITNFNIESIEEVFDYKNYWEERYFSGGNSGQGSYGLLADFKADVINNFIKENKINDVIEFGCGDGNQLKLMNYKSYLGLDISQTTIVKCKEIFKNDSSKTFQFYNVKESTDFKAADLVVCLDVLYHIIDEIDFMKTLGDIFKASKQYVILYTVLDEPQEEWSLHLKYRNVFDYIKRFNFKVEKIIKQKHKDSSKADFLILKKME